VIPKTILKSKKSEAIGTKSMEEPKPDIVPMHSAISAKRPNKAMFSNEYE
jgi:hypothetical protein